LLSLAGAAGALSGVDEGGAAVAVLGSAAAGSPFGGKESVAGVSADRAGSLGLAAGSGVAGALVLPAAVLEVAGCPAEPAAAPAASDELDAVGSLAPVLVSGEAACCSASASGEVLLSSDDGVAAASAVSSGAVEVSAAAGSVVAAGCSASGVAEVSADSAVPAASDESPPASAPAGCSVAAGGASVDDGGGDDSEKKLVSPLPSGAASVAAVSAAGASALLELESERQVRSAGAASSGAADP
jgi:hypothetical protein